MAGTIRAGSERQQSVAGIQERIRREFGDLPYPLLSVALRELDQIAFDRVAADPARVAAEMAAFDNRSATAKAG